MFGIKEIIKKMVKNNKDIIAIYRIKIYLSTSNWSKIRLFRYIILLNLFIKKNILKKNVCIYKNKLKNNISFYTESRISKRINFANSLKTAVEKDVIFIDIFDFLFDKRICKRELKEYMKNENNISTNLYKINPFGKIAYDVLKENNKKICLLVNDEADLRMEFVKKLLLENGINQYDNIFFYLNQKRGDELLDIIEEKYPSYNKFAYIGDFFQEKISNGTRSIMMIIYQNCEFWGEKFRPNINTIKMGIYCAIINNKLHNGMNKYNKSYEFGLCYGGIISYYLLIQMILNNEKFNVELDKLKQRLYNDFKNKKIIDMILGITFPKVYNNFIYDGTEEKSEIKLKDIYFSKQKDIQTGIIDFSKEYIETLEELCENNTIQYSEIKQIIKFMLENKKNTKKMLKKIYK